MTSGVLTDFGELPFFRTSGYSMKRKVLLREPERCMECGRVYISLYPLRSCRDHDGLEEI